MSYYTVKCSDGSNRNCYQTLVVEIEVEGLSDKQLGEIVKDGRTYITERQVKDSGIELDKVQSEHLAKHGEVCYECDIDSVCAACGSDQDYDDEGNNITAL